MTPQRTLVVWCRDWPIVALGASAGEPIAVMKANHVVATSPSARVAGVAEGMRRREAQRRCPEIRLADHDEDRDARAFERIAVALEAVTPRLEVCRSGSCAFPTRGPSRYFGGDEALAGRVHELVGGLLAERDACGVGIADGTFAATLAARRSLQRAGSPPVVVAPGRSAGFVAPFPVSALAALGSVPADVVDVLGRLGIRRLGELTDIPRADLLARFGRPGVLAHALASGEDDRPARLGDPPADLDQRAVFDPPAEHVEQVAFVAKTLADRLVAELAGRGLACTRLLIAFETAREPTGGAGPVERRWRDEGALSAAAMVQRVRWQLEGWLSRPGARSVGGLRSIRLHPDQVGPATGRHVGFWGDVDNAAASAMRAAARVDAILGAGSVMVPRRSGGRGAGEQVRLVPIDSMEASLDASAAAAPWPGRVARPHPASVWPTPVAAELLADSGDTVGVSGRGVLGGIPARLSIDGGPWQAVVGWAGPWLVDERWWDPLAHRRRARFQVQVATGAAHLLALEASTWWVEATYD